MQVNFSNIYMGYLGYDNLPASVIGTFGSNLGEIRTAFVSLGYNIDSFLPRALSPSVLPNYIKLIFDKNDENLWIITQGLDFRTEYMLDSQYVWAKTPIDIRSQIRRWFNFNNQMHDILSHEDCTTARQPLVTNPDENGVGELTYDRNGDIIFCRRVTNE